MSVRYDTVSFKINVHALASSSDVRFRKILNGWTRSSCGSTSSSPETCCLVTEPTSTPNESLETGVKCSILECPEGVGGVKGVRVLREEAALDLPEGVSGGSQMSFRSAGDDAVELIDIGDSHGKFFESCRGRRLRPSSFGRDVGRVVAHDWRKTVALRGVIYSLLIVFREKLSTLMS
jgi:hypothetical protein